MRFHFQCQTNYSLFIYLYFIYLVIYTLFALLFTTAPFSLLQRPFKALHCQAPIATATVMVMSMSTGENGRRRLANGKNYRIRSLERQKMILGKIGDVLKPH